MTEQKINTHIGSEIAVSVFFDYHPKEARTHQHPGSESEAEINAVYVEGKEDMDIKEVLSPGVVADLGILCCDHIEQPIEESNDC